MSEPWTDSCGPTIERSVVERMRRMDPLLRVTFSYVSIDPFTTRPLWCGDEFGYIRDPAYHLWSRDPDGRWWLVRSYPAAQGFGHREVMALEQDAARFFSPSEILRRRLAGIERRKEVAKAAYAQYHADALKANRKRINDLIDGKFGQRQAKMFSYAGQSNRSTPGDLRKSSKEDGWETRELPAGPEPVDLRVDQIES